MAERGDELWNSALGHGYDLTFCMARENDKSPVAPPIMGTCPIATGPRVESVAVTATRQTATDQESINVPADIARPTPGRWANPATISFLVSMILHTLFLIMLALWMVSNGHDSPHMLEVRLDAPSEAAPLSTMSLPKPNDTSKDPLTESPVEIADLGTLPPPNIQSNDLFVRPQSSQQATSQAERTSDPVEMFNQLDTQRKPLSLVQLPSPAGLEGRTPSERIRLGDIYGATRASETAVDRALEWLAAHQRRSGAWSFDLTADPCDGRCRNSKKVNDDTPTPSTGATGLALLAFLGAGHTQETGEYAEVVKRGLYYLRSAGSETSHGLDWQQGSMYGHGIALLAVAEATAMSKVHGKYDEELLPLVEQGTAFTCAAQHTAGSWGYVPGSPGDTTLTGWQLMSLFAARRCQVGLPSPTLPRAKRFIQSTSSDESYSFGYQRPPGEPTTTAIGMTMMLYLGDTPQGTPFDSAITRMATRGPTLTNVYHDYYATLLLHQVRHRMWDQWNEKLRDHLVRTQATEGHEVGSWHFQDRWGDIGGRLYTTAMCAMILEVYYRYLPMYGPVEAFPL